MTDATAPAALPSRTIKRDDGMTIAYHRSPGKSPGVMFLTGFMSDMTGAKALAVEDMCRRWGRACLRFDYRGHGASEGEFADGTIGEWAEDAVFVLDRLCEGPQVLVGSSMGGWIMLLAAMERPDRVAGLLGMAAAPDFTEDLIPASLTASQKEVLESQGVIHWESDYGEQPTPITKALLEDGAHHLVLRRRMPIDCPVRLIHGMEDKDVPWQTTLRLSHMLDSRDVETILVKDGGHRLSEPVDLERLERVLGGLLADIEGKE